MSIPIWTPPPKKIITELPAEVIPNPIQAPNVQRYLNKGIEDQPASLVKLWRHRPKIFMTDSFDIKLDPWQEYCVEMYYENQRFALVASKGPGKAQPLNTWINTPSGKRRFGSLLPGDYVFGENGKSTKVLSIHPQGKKKTFRVTFDDGTSTRCCDEHLWKVRGVTEKRKKTWAVKSLRELMDEGISMKMGELDYYPWQIPSQQAVRFQISKQSIQPYVMGFWLGDGSRTSGVITTADEEVETFIQKRGYETNIIDSKDRCPNITVYGLKVELRKLNMLDKYSYEKHIPNMFKYASIHQRTELLRGLMDSDGTIDKRDACCEYSSTSIELARDVQWLVRSLGGKSAKIKVKKSYLNGTRYRDCYRVRVTTRFNPFHLERKKVHWKAPSQERYFCRTIKEVSELPESEMMCISVEDPNHCYQTGNDFIVTHNTFLLAMFGWHFFMCHYRPKMAALSVTKDHLKANLWAELLMWREKSKLCTLSTNEGMERITLKGHEGYSFIDARSFPKSADQNTQASALAGLHSDNVAFLIDEAGTIPDAVLTTADAALTTAVSNTTNSKLLVTANPEVPAGLIYQAAMGKTVQKWKVHRISGDPDDPLRAPRVSINWAREQIAQFGKDDPWVLVNVFGTYPNQAADMLLTDQEIKTSVDREYTSKDVQRAQTRAGLDVSRGGLDSSCLARRKGLIAYPIEKISSALKGAELAGICMLAQQDHQIERLFVDDTGGYGSSVVDHLDNVAPMMDITPIKYNANAQDKARYFNCRTEMWVRMRDWVRKAGKLPKDPELALQLTVPRLFFKGGVFRLEEKEQIKARLGYSPDKADALAQTFADVDQDSFYGDFSDSMKDANPAIDNIDIWKQHQRQNSKASNHLSSPEQLDCNHNPHYPRHSS